MLSGWRISRRFSATLRYTGRGRVRGMRIWKEREVVSHVSSREEMRKLVSLPCRITAARQRGGYGVETVRNLRERKGKSRKQGPT
jgi:hypothetical protein